MDEKFLEFWGNLLINFAKGKKQADEASEIFQKNLTGFNEFFSKRRRGGLKTAYRFSSNTQKIDHTSLPQCLQTLASVKIVSAQ